MRNLLKTVLVLLSLLFLVACSGSETNNDVEELEDTTGTETSSSTSEEDTSSSDTADSNSTTDYNTINIKGQEVYLNGVNVAVRYWQNDFGRLFDDQIFEEMLQNISNAGGNSVRWWIYISPEELEWDTDGLPVKIDDTTDSYTANDDFIDNFETALDLALSYNIIVNPGFFSFHLPDYNGVDRTHLFTTDEGIQSVIDNLVLPITSKFNDHPAIGIWEVINEPEWVASDTSVTWPELQRFIGKIAAAIHNSNPGALVTTGAGTLNKVRRGYFSDAALMAASDDDPLAILDVYQVHYYTWMRDNYNPWEPSHWIDYEIPSWCTEESTSESCILEPFTAKPVIIGELPAEGDIDREEGELLTEEMITRSSRELHLEAIDLGYVGAWGWMYFDSSDSRSWAENACSTDEEDADSLDSDNSASDGCETRDDYDAYSPYDPADDDYEIGNSKPDLKAAAEYLGIMSEGEENSFQLIVSD